MIRCRTLGVIQVDIDGKPTPPELLWRKHLALLLYLARSPKGTRSREHLLGLLWGEKPESAARHSLNVALHILRQAVGDDQVDTSVRDICLASGAVSLDVDELDRHTAAGDWTSAAAVANGHFCDGLSIADASEFEDWLTTERGIWQRRQVDALVRRADELERTGGMPEAIRCAERALALDSASERAARSLMRNLALGGNRHAALERFDTLVRNLERSGLEPDAETRTLAGRLRSSKGILDWAPGPEVVKAPARRLPLVGRDEELGQILDLLAVSRDGSHGVLVVVEASPGLGRTRLIQEVVARAALRGTSVVMARAVAADRDEPESGIRALARGGLLNAAGVAAAPPAALAALVGRLSEWAERFPQLQQAVAMPLNRAFAEMLRMAADERPVLLVVDDAEWVDPETYAVLEGLLRDLATSRLAIAMSVSAGHSSAELDALRARMGRDIVGETVRLEPLGIEQIAKLVAIVMPDLTADQRQRLARRVLADSAGLPLFIVELLHAVAAGLDLEASTGWPAPFHTLDHTLPGDLPDMIVAAIRVGFRKLSSHAQQVLTAASVLPEKVQADQLAWVTPLSTALTVTALDELEWGRWLVADPRGYGFVARIVREVIARDMLTPGQRQRIAERASRWTRPEQEPT